ncbi:MAG: hypothetical protein GTO40_24850 [Deltaproteobacteria bacterium]|nr:hypothetical protein [Deltaproteobacteria bacterium]
MKPPLLFPLVCIAALLYLGWQAQSWPFSAKLFPMSLVAVGIVLLSFHVIRELWRSLYATEAQSGEQSMDIGIGGDEDPALQRWRSIEIWAWLVGLLLAILIIGMMISIPLFSFLYLRFHAREQWPITITITLLVGGFMYGLFEMILHTPWIEGWLWELFSS